jgi:cell division protein ZipA
MNTTSLIITLLGIIIIVGLYLMSRLALSKQPQIQKVSIPNLKNDDGSKFSSIINDIAAQDGSTPKTEPLNKVSITNNIDNKSTTESSKEKKSKQVILFISANNENGLDGNLVAKALLKNKLKLGEKSIYHYIGDQKSRGNTDKPTSNTSLFRVANGTAPWTLNDTDLHNKKLAGLSIFMSLAKQNNRKKAIETMLRVSKKLAQDINGELKNDKQQSLTDRDEKNLISL